MRLEAEVSPAVGRPVPRTYRAPALFRDLLSVFGRMQALFSIWMGGRLPRALREKVIVAVAQANACRMCEHAHTRMALDAGVTDAELAALENMDPEVLDRRTWLALAYARERTKEDFAPVSDDAQHEALVAELGAQTTLDVEEVARVMTVANRIANTLNALPDRLRGQPVPESRLADELLINFLFLPGAWFGTLIAAVRQRKSPCAVWRQARG
ncbi:MAG: carboxymuconolactone decarboxylase family protein [Polyangiales bacterium]|jgi:AhpD family alkylhydroperoxidase